MLMRLVLILNFIPLCLLLSACGKSTVDLREEILKAFDDPRQAGAPLPDTTKESDRGQGAIENIFIYVDGSQSQQGFANPAGSLIRTYNKVVNAVIDKSKVGWPGANTQIYKFGQGLVGSPITLPVIIHKSDFYNQPQTDLAAVIESFSLASAKPSLGIVITDGVQSVSKERGTLGRAINAINTWMQRGNIFGMMMYKSEFHGKAFSEISGREIGYYNNEHGDRPFYLLILAPREEEFEKFYNLLQGSNLAPDSLLLFPDLRAQSIAWARPVEQNMFELHHVDPTQEPKFFWLQKQSSARVSRIAFSFELQENKYWRSDPLRANINPLHVNVAAKRYFNIMKEWQAFGPPGVEFLTDSTSVNGKKIFVSITLKGFEENLQPGAIEAIRIRMRPRVDGVILPQWVYEVSTQDDTRLQNYNRTFNFDNFVRDIYSSYIEGLQTDLADFYIATMN